MVLLSVFIERGYDGLAAVVVVDFFGGERQEKGEREVGQDLSALF